MHGRGRIYTNVSGHKVMYYHRPFRRKREKLWKDDSPLKYGGGCLRIDQQQFKSPFRPCYLLFILGGLDGAVRIWVPRDKFSVSLVFGASGYKTYVQQQPLGFLVENKKPFNTD